MVKRPSLPMARLFHRLINLPSVYSVRSKPVHGVDTVEDFLQLSKSENKTVILVTHDIREAICLADRLLVLKGSPNQIVMDMENPLSSENHSIKEKYISKKSLEIEEKILNSFL